MSSAACSFSIAVLTVSALAQGPIHRGEPVRFARSVTDGISEMRVDAAGDLFVSRADGRLQKYSGRHEGRLWSLDLRTPVSPEGMSIYDFLVTPEGEALVLGVSEGTLETVLLRVTAGRSPSALPMAVYPGLHPVSLALSPAGQLYLLGFPDGKLFDLILQDPGLTAEERTRNFFHELDEQGAIVRSFGPVTLPPHDPPLNEFSFELSGRRLLFTRLGEPFLAMRNSGEIAKVDLETGRIEGKAPLPYRGLEYKMAVVSVEMVGEDEVAYSLFTADERRHVTGSQVRVLDLLTGQSREVYSTGPNTGAPKVLVDFQAALRVYGVFDFEPRLLRQDVRPGGEIGR